VGVCYHVLNRGNDRRRVFHRDEDYAGFLDLLARAGQRRPRRRLR
jgi:putative transposase